MGLSRRAWIGSTLAVAGLIIAINLVLFAPARLLAGWIPESTQLTFTDWRGTIWRGSAALSLPGRLPDPGVLSWELRSANPFTGRLELIGVLRAPLHQAAFEARIDGLKLELSVREGEVNHRLLAPLLAAYELSIDGDLALHNLRAELSGTIPQVTAGSIHWNGGTARYVQAGQWETLRLPALTAQVSSRNTVVVINPAGDPLLTLQLKDDGWVEISMRHAMLLLAGLSDDTELPSSTEILKVEQQLIDIH